MNREKVFAALKKIILALRDEGERFMNDQSFREECLKHQEDIQQATKKLNSCDLVWLSEVYEKWFQKEIRPCIDKLAPEIKARISWE